MALQVGPDWVATHTADEAEKELSGFKFHGPGWYLHPAYSMLVLADIPPKDSGHYRGKKHWPKETKFRFHYYDCPLSETIFGHDQLPPTRLDER